jgi:hypothetical protein
LTIVRRFAEQLPRNVARADRGLPGFLQEYQASGGQVDARPFRLLETLDGFLEMGMIRTDGIDDALRAWMPVASRVGAAHAMTVA